MKRIGIFYGSNTGTTADVAKRIGKALGVAEGDIHDVEKTAPSVVDAYDLLILGTSTWGNGDLQDDWEDFVAGLSAMSLPGKQIALFGCGDETMSDTFCSGVGELYDRIKDTGAEFIGKFDTIGYNFDHSDAVGDDGVAIGLLLDEVNHPDLTDPRIAGWTATLK
ncbi:MAG: flavodoxin [Bacteroidales bacterium]|nr:flavodoxin [Bacteroidales bacterium]